MCAPHAEVEVSKLSSAHLIVRRTRGERSQLVGFTAVRRILDCSREIIVFPQRCVAVSRIEAVS